MGLALKFQERERGATAMKITLVNFIIATVIIITMVKAGPLRVQIELTPMSGPKQDLNSGPKTQASGAYRLCAGKGQTCTSAAQCCSKSCVPRGISSFTMQCM